MEITVNFLDNLRLEAKFDDFTVITDQPIRYKGDGSAPSPFDYFLASSALCAAYFVRVYCLARDIPTVAGADQRGWRGIDERKDCCRSVGGIYLYCGREQAGRRAGGVSPTCRGHSDGEKPCCACIGSVGWAASVA